VRYYTYSVGAYLVNELKIAGAVDKILHDGRDIIHCRLITGESIMIYLIDSAIPAYEIRNILTTNTANNDHTLFIIWVDMLLPDHGRVVELTDWESYLLAAYGGRIYGYKIYMQELFMFPLYFEPVSNSTKYRVVYGDDLIDVGAIHPHRVKTVLDGLTGEWLTASFDGDPDAYHRHRAQNLQLPPTDQLRAYYAVLGLEIGAERAQIKAAFRKLARQYHPDLNPAEDASEKMQALNIAYEMILKSLE